MTARALCTAPANALLQSLPTNRMPAFLSPDDWETWLGAADAPGVAIRATPQMMDGSG
jgi:hypothetical protein